MLEKAPLNFPVYALRDIETAVREGFRVGQKMSFCELNSFCSRISISFSGLRLYCINKTQSKIVFVTLRQPCWCPFTKRYKCGINISPNKAPMKNRTVLNLGEVISIVIIYHIPDSWLHLLNDCEFYFGHFDHGRFRSVLKGSQYGGSKDFLSSFCPA